MMKRSQELRMLDRLKRYGHITYRVAQEQMKINNPFERMRTIREHLKVDDFYVKTKAGTRFKIFHISKRKALNYAKRNGFELAA